MAFFETVVDAVLNLQINGVSLDSLLGVALVAGVAVVGYTYVHGKMTNSKK